MEAGSHWVGDFVDPRDLLDFLESEKTIVSTEIRNQERLAPSLVTTVT